MKEKIAFNEYSTFPLWWELKTVSRFSPRKTVLMERLNRTNKDLVKNYLEENVEGKWIGEKTHSG